jgi:hypothetical protein
MIPLVTRQQLWVPDWRISRRFQDGFVLVTTPATICATIQISVTDNNCRDTERCGGPACGGRDSDRPERVRTRYRQVFNASDEVAAHLVGEIEQHAIASVNESVAAVGLQAHKNMTLASSQLLSDSPAYLRTSLWCTWFDSLTTDSCVSSGNSQAFQPTPCGTQHSSACSRTGLAELEFLFRC